MLFAGWYFGGGKQALFAFGFLSIFLLQYNCFTLLCYFPLYSEVYQPYATCIPSLLDLPPTQAFHFAHPRSSQSTVLSCLCYIYSSYLAICVAKMYFINLTKEASKWMVQGASEKH